MRCGGELHSGGTGRRRRRRRCGAPRPRRAFLLGSDPRWRAATRSSRVARLNDYCPGGGGGGVMQMRDVGRNRAGSLGIRGERGSGGGPASGVRVLLPSRTSRCGPTRVVASRSVTCAEFVAAVRSAVARAHAARRTPSRPASTHTQRKHFARNFWTQHGTAQH